MKMKDEHVMFMQLQNIETERVDDGYVHEYETLEEIMMALLY